MHTGQSHAFDGGTRNESRRVNGKQSKRIRLAAEAEVQEGQTIKFNFEQAGKWFAWVLLRHQGRLAAYENRCMHMPLTLDYGDNRFFTSDGRHVICQTHGAIYEPLTGLCTKGPCVGASLRPLSIECEQGSVWLVLELS